MEIAKHMAKFSGELLYRSSIHDLSKFSDDEFDVNAANVQDFGKFPFNSPQELELRERLAPAQKLHKKRNRHHPEHFEDGVDGMNLIDVLEMLVDWKASSSRYPGDSMRKSLNVCVERYNFSPQLVKILENTCKDFNLF